MYATGLIADEGAEEAGLLSVALESGQVVYRFGPDWSRAGTMQALAPRGLEMIQVYDETEYITSAIRLVQQSLVIGGVLAIVALALIVVLFRLAMKLDSTHFDPESLMEANGMLFGLGGGGLGLLAFAWVWAAVSSFLIANESKTSN